MHSRDELLGQRIPRETRQLYEEAAVAIRASGRVDDDWIDQRLPAPNYETLRVVATGLYSGGKSTVLRALTGDDSIEIDADIMTSQAREYRWQDVLLVDTPGVRAGIPLHDERADLELRRADFILFVVSVNLPDDDARDHLDYVCNYLGRAEETILVLNKTSLSAADPAVRQRELSDLTDRLGLHLPIVMIDARDVLRAEAASDEDRTDLLTRSRFDTLVAEMNRLTRERGAGARLASPLHSLTVALDEADALLSDPGWERDARRLLTSRSAMVESGRARLLNRMTTLEAGARRDIEELGEKLAEALTFDGGGITEAQRSAFITSAKERAVQLLSDIGEEFERTGAWLDSQGRQIERGPALEALKLWIDVDAVDLSDASMDDMARQGAPGSEGRWAARGRDAKSWSAKASFAGTWIAKQMADPSKGPGHAMIIEFGHFFGHKFRPWEAVRWAGRIGKAGEIAAKWAPLIGVAAELAGQAIDEAVERKRLAELRAAQDEIRGEVSSAADFLIARVREESIRAIESGFDDLREPLEKARQELDEAEGSRSQARTQILDLRLRSLEFLAQVKPVAQRAVDVAPSVIESTVNPT